MPALAETVVLVMVAALVVLLSLRILLSVPGWVRRFRRPEARAVLVIGVGGGGSNAVDRMVGARLASVGFVACNTDAQALRSSRAETRMRIGDAITGGLGSGGDPEVGRRAAESDRDRIAGLVAGADLVFVTAGLGGGTGSGAAPVVAASAREQGALTIAVVTTPFGFEGSQRRRIADAAAIELAAEVDALIVVANDRVGDVLAEEATMIDAFRVVDDVLLQAVSGIIELIQAPGLINLDFADVRSVLENAGPALIGLGVGTGEHRALDAARLAIASPLLEASIDGARGILFNVSGPADLRMGEVRMAADAIRERADPDANVIFGASFSKVPGEDVRLTLIVTGLTGHERPQPSMVAARGDRAQLSRTERSRGSRIPDGPPSTGAPGSSVEVADPLPRPALAIDEDELEVPSFLRQRRRTATAAPPIARKRRSPDPHGA